MGPVRQTDVMSPASDPHDEYENPLATRYAGEAMRKLFSARHRIRTWRSQIGRAHV